MIIVLHGKDNFRTDQKLKSIISGYKKKNKSGINITYLPDSPSFNDLKDESRQLGMFEEKRLLIGRNVLQDKNLKKKIEKNLEELVKGDNILILKENNKIKGKFGKKIESLDKSKGMIQEFEELKGRKLKSWYKKEFSKYNTKLERGVVSKLINYVGNDLWRASNEISKLANMKLNEEVSVNDVSKHVRPDFNTDIFETIDSLGKGNKGKAIELVQEHIRKGDSPFYILSMINYQVRNLLTVKELEEDGLSYKKAKKESKMSPFVFKKTKAQAKNFTFDQTKKIHRELFRVDLDSKLGKITPQIGLMLIISRF
ncbi:MAG: DNA polymerase III subunit delta [Patescibacteria group bacterium]